MHCSNLQPHSITSSARASSVGGTVRPRALAVLRLITSSNFSGAWTGSSLGFAPFKMLGLLRARALAKIGGLLPLPWRENTLNR
jgi:hypothetical protein